MVWFERERERERESGVIYTFCYSAAKSKKKKQNKKDIKPPLPIRVPLFVLCRGRVHSCKFCFISPPFFFVPGSFALF